MYSAVLHLAPADRSGHEVCPFRSAGCTQACLNLSGHTLIAVQHEAKERGISVEDAARDFSQETVIQRARVGRTERFFEAEQGRRKGRNPTTRELAPFEASRPQQGSVELLGRIWSATSRVSAPPPWPRGCSRRCA